MISTYIFCTEEVSETPIAFLDEIDSILNDFKNNYVFTCKQSKDQIILEDKIEKFNDPDKRLDISEFFDICKYIRKRYGYGDQEFIVLLTNKRNTNNWLSATDGQNIYINVKDLGIYSSNLTKYPITFQIIENLFQARCGIVFNNGIIDPRLHQTPEGCINDICTQKSRIINKLQEAKICRNCKKIARESGMDDTEIEFFNEFLKIIKNVRYVRVEKKSIGEKLLKVDESGTISINDVEVDIDALPRSFYLFFLQQKEGLAPYKMRGSIKNIATLYQKIKHKGEFKFKVSESNIERVRTKIVGVEGSINPNFYKTVNTINAGIKSSVDINLVNLFYLQSNENNLYSIVADKSMIEIHENFLLDN